MADERIKDLPDEVIVPALNALIDTLYLPVDDTSFTDAKKILWKTLLKNTPVVSGGVAYQAVTSLAFWESLMSDTVRGIGQFSTDLNVTAKSGTGILNTAHQVLMQAQWLKDWFESNPVPNIYTADNIAIPNVMRFDVTFNNPLTAGQAIAISPVLPAGRRFDYVTFSFAARANLSNGGFGVLEYSGSRESFFLVTPLYLDLSADGRELSIRASLARSIVLVSLSINAIIIPS